MYLSSIKIIVIVIYIALVSGWLVREYYEGEISDGRLKRIFKDED